MERRSLKNQGFNGIRTRDLCDTSAMLYQLSYEATHWERGQFIEFISPVRSEMMWSIYELFRIYFTSMWRYDIPTCEDIDHFTDIKFVTWIVLKIVGASSKLLRVFLENRRQSSEIFGNCWKMSRHVRLAFKTILKNLQKSLESGRKSSENHQKGRH